MELSLFGFALGIAASNVNCALGPWYLYYHPELFTQLLCNVHWVEILKFTSGLRKQNSFAVMVEQLTYFSQLILPFSAKRSPFCVIGGDHSCAIATWSAVAVAQRSLGDIGLIWIDAHMDSHTPLTSISQNLHGMPVAHLLGEGLPELCNLLDSKVKIKPQNLCLLGIRSYEPAEALLLNKLGVKVYFMQEIMQRGLLTVLKEAWDIVSQTTCGVGLSIDLDGIDPKDAPGVGNPEPNGIVGQELILALRNILATAKLPLLGMEIAEYNPINDVQHKTADLLINLIQTNQVAH